jgi:outer membrane immunogenic protein
MRRLALALVATAALTQLASAADLPAKAYTKAPAMVAAYDWTGFYIGGNLGYGWGRVDMTNRGPSTFFAPVGGSDTISSRGFVGGGQIGYNWQMGQLVTGVELMLDGADMRQTNTSIFFPFSDTWRADVTALFSATGRIGFDAGGWLPYVKGGFATGRVRTAMTTLPNVTAESANWHSGWTLGVGFEYMLTRNWTLGAEYDYYGLSSKDVSGPLAVLGGTQNWTVRPRLSTLTARVNYKF